MTAPINYAGKKGLGWLFLFIVLAFVIGSFVFTNNNTFDEHSPVENLDSMIYAIEALTNGDAGGFIEGLFGAIPVIAVFLVVFGILHFLSTTVMKRLFKTKKIATIFALIVTIYAFINNKIYNYIISLNAFTIGLLVFFLLIIMLWGLGKHGKKEHDSVLKLLKESSAKETESKKLLEATKGKSREELKELLDKLDEEAKKHNL